MIGGMDDEPEPWEAPDDTNYGEEEGYRFPSSWDEIKERWHADTFLRLVIGVVVVTILGCLFLCSGWRRT
jgi:hypothetical protein